MKSIIYIFFFFSFAIVFSQKEEIHWISLEDALEKQKNAPKNIILNVYTNWCGPCKVMNRNTYGNKDVINYINQNFYAVKFNGEGAKVISYYNDVFQNPNYNPTNVNGRNSTHEFTKYLRIDSYPATVFISDMGDLLFPIIGYHTPKQLEPYLKMLTTGDYLKFQNADDFKKYLRKFSNKFKN